MTRRAWVPAAVSLALAAVAPALAGPPAPPSVFDHVAIQVVDLDKSVAFYKALFGLAEVPAPFAGARWLKLGGGVMLHIVGHRTSPSVHSRWDHIAIAGGDMDATVARLDTRHVAWTNMEGLHTPQVPRMA